MINEPGYLENILNTAPLYKLLFPGVQVPVDKEANQPVSISKNRLISNFLGNILLPVTSTGELTVEQDNTYTVLLNGKLDEEKYPEEKVRHIVRGIKDQYNSKVDLSVKHTEKYLINESYFLAEAAIATAYMIPGFCNCDMIHTLTLLN